MFSRVVFAVMCAGEVTLALSLGAETQTDPAEVAPGVGGGSGAGAGNCATPLVGPAASSTVTLGQEEGVPPFDEPGGDPAEEELLSPAPQPINAAVSASKETAEKAAGKRRASDKGNHLLQIGMFWRLERRHSVQDVHGARGRREIRELRKRRREPNR